MARMSCDPTLWALAATICALAAGSAFAETPATAKPQCLPTSETREEIKAHRLLEPFVALKDAASTVKAEALSAKLCRLGDEFVYEITLLHRNGQVVHVAISAASGKLVGAHASREAPPRN